MKDKEEFSREDPRRQKTTIILALVNYIVPIVCVFVGLFISTQKFAFYMNYDETVMGSPLFELPNGYKVYNPLFIVLGLLKFGFNENYSYYFFKAFPATFIGLVLAILVFVVCSIVAGARQHNQHIHGTSRWGTKKDLEKVGLLQEHGVVCGQLTEANVGYHVNPEKASLQLDMRKSNYLKFNLDDFKVYRPIKTAPLIAHSGATNTWLIAPTRAGKGVSCIIPTLLSLGVPYYAKEKNKTTKKTETVIKGKRSVVVFDPKGENYDITAGYRAKFSTVMPFRPLDPDGETVHYNPIHEIPDNPSGAFAWADMIGEIFFGAEKAQSSGDGASEYFKNMARDIFVGVVMHVRFSKSIPWEEKNLTKVLSLFAQDDDESEEEKKGGDDEESGCGFELFKQMKEEGIHVRDDGTENPIIHNLIVASANKSKKQPSRERGSTFSTVFSKINLFQDPLIQQATAYSDFSIDDFVNGINPISLYLIVPYNHIKRISPVFRMLITFMIKKFSDGTTNAREVKLKNPCVFLLDEFPVLGYFPDIALNAGILAGYGVTFFIVSQSLNQIVDIYGEKHPFLDHCKTLILFASGNNTDAQMFANSIGNRSVLLDNISRSGSRLDLGLTNISKSAQETSVSLVSADELQRLEFNRCIVMNQGVPPYKGKKVVYYEDPRFKDKSFLPTPKMEDIFNRIKKLPSHKVKHFVALDSDLERLKKKIKESKELKISKMFTGTIF